MIQHKIFHVCAGLIIVLAGISQGQQIGQIGMSVNGVYSQPLAGLSDWFKPAISYAASIGWQNDQDWYFSGEIEYAEFDDENLSGYPKDRLNLNLKHIGILFNARYRLLRSDMFLPYLMFAAGPHYWKGTRGEILANPELSIPFIAERTLEEWNWGFKAGIGLETNIAGNLYIDLGVSYRFIVGDLWPTLQQYIELDGVSGFQTLNYTAGVKYYFD